MGDKIDITSDNQIMREALNLKIESHQIYQANAQDEINDKAGVKWAGGKHPRGNWGGRHPEISIKHYQNTVRESSEKQKYLEKRIRHAEQYPENSYMRRAILWDACNETGLWDAWVWDPINEESYSPLKNIDLTITKDENTDKKFGLYKKLMQLDRHRAELYVKGQIGDKVAETKATELGKLLKKVDTSIKKHFDTDKLQTQIESDLKSFSESPELQAHRHWASKIAQAVLNALFTLTVIGPLVKLGITKTAWFHTSTKSETEINTTINDFHADGPTT